VKEELIDELLRVLDFPAFDSPEGKISEQPISARLKLIRSANERKLE